MINLSSYVYYIHNTNTLIAQKMNPNVWGPHLWLFLHVMSLTYAKNRLHPTKKEKAHMFQFLYHLQFTLPCASCRTNYAKYFERHPPRLGTRRELFEWLVDLHNSVNRKNNKPLFTYKEAETLYRTLLEKA